MHSFHQESVDYELLVQSQRDGYSATLGQTCQECSPFGLSVPDVVETVLVQSDTCLWWHAWELSPKCGDWLCLPELLWKTKNRSKSCCRFLCQIHELEFTTRVSPWVGSVLFTVALIWNACVLLKTSFSLDLWDAFWNSLISGFSYPQCKLESAIATLVIAVTYLALTMFLAYSLYIY